MNLDSLQNQTIGILGFGKEGQSVAKFLFNKGFNFTIYDHKPIEEWSEPAQELAKNLNLVHSSGEEYLLKAINSCNVLFRSPGIRIPEDLRQLGFQKDLQITSQTKWFFDNCPAKIIGVTGTKGKGTTASLIAHILENSNVKFGNLYLTGNIGRIEPLAFLESVSEQDIIVYELSSFQLQDLGKSPHIGVCLMVTQDHLDYHSNLEEYHSAKQAICKFQTPDDYTIYNSDYPASKNIGSLGSGRKFAVSKMNKPVSGVYIDVLTQQLVLSPFDDQELTLNVYERLLPGEHNLENIAAASLAAYLAGATQEEIEEGVKTFKGLNDRLEFVGEVQGVRYVNDSISTNIDTCIAAIKSFDKPIVLLLGGASKKLDYHPLIKFLDTTTNLKAVVLIGDTGKEIYDLNLSSTLKAKCTEPFTTFEEAVRKAVSLAGSGDVVLLSPASTSFDMFHSYSERGQTFKDIINNL